MGVRVAAMVLLVACVAAAQARGQATEQVPELAPGSRQAAETTPESQQTQLQTELKKLGDAAESLERDLPSFTCTETGLSEALKKGKVKAQARFVANVRVHRVAAERLDEELEVSEVNGKPVTGRFEPPYMVAGGFGESLMYFLPDSQQCFDYTLSAGRVDFKSRARADRARCSGMGSPTGFALVDVAGNPVHLERTVPHELAEKLHIVDSTASDFAQMEMDGKAYPLAAKLVANQVKEEGISLHFEATYTGCHLFKASSRILPGETVVPDGGTPQP